MGIDAIILVEVDGDDPPDIHLASSFRWEPAGGAFHEDCPGANFELYNLCRYFNGYDYYEFSWPTLCPHLLQLLGHPRVKKVWYGGDCSLTPYELDFERFTKLNEAYIRVRRGGP